MRDAYADVGVAIRQAHERARDAGDLTRRDWRVLSAIVALVASYSRLVDRLTVGQIAEAAGVDERNTKRALARLRDRGVIVRAESRGRRPAETGLPQPGPHTATVEPGPQRATVDREPGPCAAPVTTGQPGPESSSNSGRPRPPTREEREESSAHARASLTAPPGPAGGRAAQPEEDHRGDVVAAVVASLPDTPWRDGIARAIAAQHARQLELRIEGRGDELAARAARREEQRAGEHGGAGVEEATG